MQLMMGMLDFRYDSNLILAIQNKLSISHGLKTLTVVNNTETFLPCSSLSSFSSHSLLSSAQNSLSQVYRMKEKDRQMCHWINVIWFATCICHAGAWRKCNPDILRNWGRKRGEECLLATQTTNFFKIPTPTLTSLQFFFFSFSFFLLYTLI